MRDLSELLWLPKPIDQPISGVKEFEQEFGFVLPSSYLTFLQHSNGGRVKLNAFDTADGQSSSAVSDFYCMTKDREDSYGVWDNTLLLRAALTESLTIGVAVYDGLTYYTPDDPILSRFGDVSEPMNLQFDAVAIGEDGGGNIIFMDMKNNKNQTYIFFRDEPSLFLVSEAFEGFVDTLYER